MARRSHLDAPLDPSAASEQNVEAGRPFEAFRGNSVYVVNKPYDAEEAERLRREYSEWRANVENLFPFEVEKVSGRIAYRRWQELSRRSDITPVILGDRDSLARIAQTLDEDSAPEDLRTPETSEILKSAAMLSFPSDYRRFVEEQSQKSAAFVQKVIADDPELEEEYRRSGWDPETAGELYQPPEGPWPEWTGEDHEPSWERIAFITHDGREGDPYNEVFIALLPTTDATETPAHLRYGNWNAYPPADHHVAALRSFEERFGATLVALTSSVVVLDIARPVQSREEALALAREIYLYCPDSIEQGAGSLQALAASLLGAEQWWFWWD